MKTDRMPVTPEVIRWAREQAGVSLAEAQGSFRDIEGWESGDVQPTYCQLEKYADQYKVPIAVFFFPEPPQLPPISKSFRTLPSAEFDELPSRIRLLMRKAKAFQLGIEEIFPTEGSNRRFMLLDLSFGKNTPIPRMARDVRNYLNVSIDDQHSWNDPSHALNNWRSAFFRSGVFVFKDQFRDKRFNGFCLYDRLTPLIYVNNSSTKTRQIFTLFHELAHLLFRTSGIDSVETEYAFDHDLGSTNLKSSRASSIEVKCNAFATEALVPNIEFEKYIDSMEVTEEIATSIASNFHVSRELIFRRFRDKGLVSQDQYMSAVMKWNSQQTTKNASGNFYNNIITYLGREYIGVVLKKYYANQISEEQLADYLNVKVKNLEGLELHYQRGMK